MGEIVFIPGLASIVFFASLGRAMALRRNRNAFGWGLAGAVFPPFVLIPLSLAKTDRDPVA